MREVLQVQSTKLLQRYLVTANADKRSDFDRLKYVGQRKIDFSLFFTKTLINKVVTKFVCERRMPMLAGVYHA